MVGEEFEVALVQGLELGVTLPDGPCADGGVDLDLEDCVWFGLGAGLIVADVDSLKGFSHCELG